MWHDTFVMGIPFAEKVGRTVAVYVSVLVLLRLLGRRDLAQFTTFDLVVVLLLSNVVQNALIGPDNSVTGGIVGAAVLLLVSAVVGRIGTATDATERFFEGQPTTLAQDGHFDQGALRRLGIRARDVKAALRVQGACSVTDVETAELMPSGTLVVQLRDTARPATEADVRRLLARIDAMEAALSGR